MICVDFLHLREEMLICMFASSWGPGQRTLPQTAPVCPGCLGSGLSGIPNCVAFVFGWTFYCCDGPEARVKLFNHPPPEIFKFVSLERRGEGRGGRRAPHRRGIVPAGRGGDSMRGRRGAHRLAGRNSGLRSGVGTQIVVQLNQRCADSSYKPARDTILVMLC